MPDEINLHGSLWAPRSSRSHIVHSSPNKPSSDHAQTLLSTTTSSSTSDRPLSRSQRDVLTRRQEYTKFIKLNRRLKWKSLTLLACYYRALNHMHTDSPLSINGAHVLLSRHEAETMFKIDFFEFYVLLERVLVHLLAVFGMQVSAGHATSVPANTYSSLIGDSRFLYGPAAMHRYHANVLAALDQPTSPLHHVLGCGVVRDYLGIAKEFRNRWKDVEDKDTGEDGLVGSRYEKMLKDLNLEVMLGDILLAIDQAAAISEEELTRLLTLESGSDNKNGEVQDMMMTMELDAMHGDEGGDKVPWEAMADAMEIE